MLLVILLLAWPVVEIFVAIKVAQAIGALEMLVLLILTWPLGMWAMRSQGRAVLRRLSAAIAAGRPPGREVLDGALVLLGGVLLIVPGFITDAIGVLLLAPPSRALARLGLVRNLQSRVVVRAARFGRRPYDVDSTGHDIDGPQLHR